MARPQTLFPLAAPHGPSQEGPGTREPTPQDRYRTGLARTFQWFTFVGIAVGGLYAGAAALLGSSGYLFPGAIAIAAGVGIYGARRCLVLQRDVAAALLLIVTLLSCGLFYSIVRPGSLATVALVPLIAVALAMPLVRPEKLRMLAGWSWMAGVGLVVLNIVLPGASAPVSIYTISLRIAGYGSVLAIVFALLIVYNKRLNDLMQQTRAGVQSVKAANVKLLELDHAKTHFMNTVSHELRTPLTPVLLQLRLMSGGTHGPLTEKQQRSLLIVERNVERLNSITQELLDIARLQSDQVRLDLATGDLDALVREAVESFRAVAAAKGITLNSRTGEGTRIRIDPQRISQVVYNLLNNAIKYTPEGGTVTVETERTDDHIELRVNDTGIGIAPEDQKRLFQAFSRIHDQEGRTDPGTGLGLYICKNIIHAHGGQIHAESDGAGKGSTFSFMLPLKTSRKKAEITMSV